MPVPQGDLERMTQAATRYNRIEQPLSPTLLEFAQSSLA
jgi:hypothetical protein